MRVDHISQDQRDSEASVERILSPGLRVANEPERKARLYRVALVRRVWDEVPWIARALTELAERQADGTFDPATLPRTLARTAEELLFAIQRERDASTVLGSPVLAEHARHLIAAGCVKPPGADSTTARLSLERLHELAWLALGTHFEWAEGIDVSAGNGFDSVPLLRDLFGDPHQRVALAPAWRTDTVVALARQMYDSREFGAMPILADALQDAGCDNLAILDHCRDANQPHVRGCWVCDWALGRE